MAEERAYFWTGYVLIAIIVFLPLMMFMNRASDADTFKEELISNELALMSDFMLGSDDKILVEYKVNQKKNYRIGFSEKCLFVVALEGTGLEQGSKTYCADNLFITKKYLDAQIYKKIILDKKGNEFSVKGETIE